MKVFIKLDKKNDAASLAFEGPGSRFDSKDVQLIIGYKEFQALQKHLVKSK